MRTVDCINVGNQVSFREQGCSREEIHSLCQLIVQGMSEIQLHQQLLEHVHKRGEQLTCKELFGSILYGN